MNAATAFRATLPDASLLKRLRRFGGIAFGGDTTEYFAALESWVQTPAAVAA